MDRHSLDEFVVYTPILPEGARGGHSPRFCNLRAAEKVKQVKHLKI